MQRDDWWRLAALLLTGWGNTVATIALVKSVKAKTAQRKAPAKTPKRKR